MTHNTPKFRLLLQDAKAHTDQANVLIAMSMLDEAEANVLLGQAFTNMLDADDAQCKAHTAATKIEVNPWADAEFDSVRDALAGIKAILGVSD